MNEPDFVLDAAQVLRYAELDPRAHRFGAVVAGVPVDSESVKALAIAESLFDGTIFLLHCNADWETVAASTHAGAEAAQAYAGETYGAALQPWTPYRALTAEEEGEIRTTRAFLRDLASEG